MGLVLAIVTFLAPEYWVERLGADAIVTREDAGAWLKWLGWASMPALLAAEQHPDAEVAERVRILLGSIPVRDKLSPAMRRRMPGVEDRLAAGSDDVWLEVFLQARLDPAIPERDLLFLLDRASRGAQAQEEKIQLVLFIVKARHRSTLAILENLLRDGDPRVSDVAWEALDQLPTSLRLEAIVRSGEVRPSRIRPRLEDLPCSEAIEILLPMLRATPDARSTARVFREMHRPQILEDAIYGRPRRAAIEFLGWCGRTEDLIHLMPAVHDFDVVTRVTACTAITRILSRP